MKKIVGVRARDLMRKNVVALSPDDSISTAVGVLEDAQISGAPVVSSSGRLVGVLTLTDLARSEHLSEDRIETQRGEREMSEPVGEELTDELDPSDVFFRKDEFSADLRGAERVGDWMTRDVISVGPDAPLERVCRTMLDQHVHRVFVCEETKLIGVVTSFDIVRCVAEGAPARRKQASSAKR
jgi:CBS domain-containing protein